VDLSTVYVKVVNMHVETLDKLKSLNGCDFYISPIVIAEVYTRERPKEKA